MYKGHLVRLRYSSNESYYVAKELKMGFLATTVNTNVLNRFGIEIRRHRSPSIIQILSYFNFDTVIDVGANIGQFASSILDNGFQGEIFSIEPSSEAFNELVADSKRYQNWHVIPRCALGAFEGEAKLNLSANSYSSSILNILSTHTRAAPESAYISEESVRLETLDGLFASDTAKGRNCFLKLDVQGFEDRVLAGGKRFLERIGGVKIELSILQLYTEQSLHSELISSLEKSGFSLWNLEPGFSHEISGRTFQYDAVLIHSSLMKESNAN
jgi:FkbM family methyltransferase